MGGQAIFENFTKAVGPEGLAVGAATMNEVARSYNERGDRIRQIVAKMDAAWRGNAAGAAQRGVGPLAVEHGLAAPAMDMAQDLATRQAGSFGDAKNAVVPVPPAPERVDPMAAFLIPGVFSTYGKQLDAHKVAAQHNVDVMNGYGSASVYNTNMPKSYGRMDGSHEGIQVVSPPPSGPGGGSGGGGKPSGPVVPPRPPGRKDGGGQAGGGDNTSAGPSSGGGTIGSGTSSGTGGGAAVQGTEPDRYVPPLAPSGGSSKGSGFPGRLPSQGEQATGFGGVPVGPLSGGDARGSGGGVGGRGPGVGGPGSGAGQGAGGGRSVGEPAAGQNPAARGGAVAGRGVGPGGVPMAAGMGKGRGGEDEEHKHASYLQEPDPHEVFGTDEVTAPPVIGGQP
jgi:hypothetical protein